ncbi:transcription factor Adf-1-like [Diorhabda sublineata]|uniref:transcription factor Adf-1-like n=1 Tax=Diorhabda sublineata TaxID=1163346 RepID=UPI0024E07B88|nr:transcription factor Adf-1-like [Diorhabda sublineata]
MSFSDEDCENLIELIRQHPPLYNAQLDSYRDENLKNNIWKSIAESINKTDSECRKKWKLIRDSYNRYKRKQKQSTGFAAPAKNSKWQFYERLRFLENTPSERQDCTSIEEEQQSSASVEKEVTNTSTGVEHEDTPHEGADTSLESLKSQESVDDISIFTKHIEMMLRKLSARSRAMVKTEIFNIVSKYEFRDIKGQTERPYTSSPSYFPTIAALSGPQAQSDSSRQLSYNSNSS